MKKPKASPRIAASQDRRFAMFISKVAEEKVRRNGGRTTPPQHASTSAGMIVREDPASGFSGGPAVIAAIKFSGASADVIISLPTLTELQHGYPQQTGRRFIEWRHRSGPVIVKEKFGTSELDSSRQYAWQTGANALPTKDD